MPRINLLPWREQLREERKREFFVSLGVVASFAILIVLLVHIAIGGMIKKEKQKNKYLRDQITLLDQKIKEIRDLKQKKQNLIARMEVIQDLQANRSMIVHLFDDMVRVMPDGIRLNEIKRRGEFISFTGQSESNARVSKLMRNIGFSDYVTAPRLSEIKASKKEKGQNEDSNFALTMDIVPPQHTSDGKNNR